MACAVDGAERARSSAASGFRSTRGDASAMPPSSHSFSTGAAPTSCPSICYPKRETFDGALAVALVEIKDREREKWSSVTAATYVVVHRWLAFSLITNIFLLWATTTLGNIANMTSEHIKLYENNGDLLQHH